MADQDEVTENVGAKRLVESGDRCSRSILRSLSALSVFALALGVASVFAESSSHDAQREFSVPAGSLESVLLEIALQAKCPISFNPSLVTGLRGTSIQGAMTVREALAQAVDGFDVEVLTATDGGWTLRPSTVPARLQGADLPVYALPDISVVGRRTAEYDERNILVQAPGTITPQLTPASQIPLPISSIGSAMAKRQNARDLADVLQNASGVSPVFDTTHSFSPGFRIRGLDSHARTVDGMLDAAGYPAPIEGIHRVDIVKGPADATQGNLSGNGVINIITKRPEFKDSNELGSHLTDKGRGKLVWDVSGMMGHGDKWGYRLDVMTQHAACNGGLNASPGEDYVAPSLRFRDANTDWTLGIQRYRQRPEISPFAVTVGGRPYEGASPISPRSIGEERVNTATRTYSLLEHQLGSDWRWRSRASWSSYRARYRYFLPSYLWEEDLQMRGYVQEAETESRRQFTSISSELLWSHRMGAVQQNLLFGMDRTTVRTRNCECGPVVSGSVDLASREFNADERYDAFDREGLYRLGATGTYLQEQLAFGDSVHILASIRRSHSKLESTIPWAAWWDELETTTRTASTSSGLGISIQLTPEIAVYGGVTKGVNSVPAGVSAGGQGLLPENIRQKDVGLKFNLFDDKLQAALALFRLRSDNTNLPQPWMPTYYVTLPGQSIQGLEVEVVGQLRPGWDIAAAFTSVGAQLNDNVYPVYSMGTDEVQAIPGQPKRFGRLWSSYAFQDQALKNWGLSFGLTAVSRSYADVHGTVTVPGYRQFDASVFCRTSTFSVELGVKNLTDARSYGPTVSPWRISILPSRTVELILKHIL